MAKKTSQQAHVFIEFMHWLKAIAFGLLIFIVGGSIIYLIPQPFYSDGFRNLSELQTKAQELDEWIKMDGKNVLFPVYESYYQKQFAPGIKQTIKNKADWLLTSLHLKKKPIFSASFFKTILEDVTKYRQSKGWVGDFIQKIETTPTTKIVVFGVTQGAFHGLIRYLEQLKQMNIIDENLRLQNPDYYLVFLGNVVNRSPYTLEMFSLVLRLLQRNPDNVIYLRGTQEISDTWRQHTLRRELELRANYLSKESIPLEKEVDAFFNTLPWTLYCTIPFLQEPKLNYFKCAAFIEDERILNMIDAPTYATFLKQKSSERLSAFNLKNRNALDPEAGNIASKALVRDIKKRHEYEAMNGLRLLAPTKGVTTWTILSSATEPARVALNFYYDAFTIINATPVVENWTIDLFNRDIRKQQETTFNKKSFYFFSGQQI